MPKSTRELNDVIGQKIADEIVVFKNNNDFTWDDLQECFLIRGYFVSVNTLVSWSKSLTVPSVGALVILCDVLGIKINEFIEGISFYDN
ncbi:hypothetical protein M5361_13705 [Ligilactobacillus agilis]|nr:hypothetical protein [Ligilactobacillus agilis]